MRLKDNLAADGALLMTTLIWGSTFVTAKDILDQWPPLAYLTLRFALAAVALAVLFHQPLRRARRSEWLAGVRLGALIGGAFAVQAIGQVYTTPSKSAFVTGLTTPLVPFIAFLAFGARPGVENLIGVTLASIGGALVLAPQEGRVNTGDLITLGCTVLFAMHIALMSVYARRYDVRQLTALQIVVAAAIFLLIWSGLRVSVDMLGAEMLPAALAREASPLAWNIRVASQLVYLALVGTVVAFLFWTWGQARTSATQAAIIFSLEPVFATLFAVAVRGANEWTGGRASVGAALIFVGIIISEVRRGERGAAPDGRSPKAEGRRTEVLKESGAGKAINLPR